MHFGVRLIGPSGFAGESERAPWVSIGRSTWKPRIRRARLSSALTLILFS